MFIGEGETIYSLSFAKDQNSINTKEQSTAGQSSLFQNRFSDAFNQMPKLAKQEYENRHSQIVQRSPKQESFPPRRKQLTRSTVGRNFARNDCLLELSKLKN